MGRTLISAARLRGAKYARCEDHVAYRRYRGWSIVALADGAGSCHYGAEGARLVTSHIVKRLPAILKSIPFSSSAFRDGSYGHNLAQAIVIAIHDTISKESVTETIKPYSSTLLFALWHDKLSRWIVGHIGDGAIGAVDNLGTIHTVSSPDNGEFANETFFVTQHNAASHLRLYLLNGASGVVMMSDGAAHTFYANKDKKFASGISRFFTWQREIGEAQMRSVIKTNLRHFAAKKSDDDASIMMIQQNQCSGKNFRVHPFHKGQ